MRCLDNVSFQAMRRSVYQPETAGDGFYQKNVAAAMTFLSCASIPEAGAECRLVSRAQLPKQPLHFLRFAQQSVSGLLQ